MRYYYCTDQQTVKGPLHYEILRQMVLIKLLPKNFAVCREGTEQWEEYSTCVFPTPEHPLTKLFGANIAWWQSVVLVFLLLGMPVVFGIWISQPHPRTNAIAISAPTPQPQADAKEDTPLPSRLTIMGSSKEQVDSILHDWTSQVSQRSTSLLRIYRYTKDVEMGVTFKNSRAIGVYVIDRPGAGTKSISQSRFSELVTLIGETPNSNDIGQDASGIHEFGVGEN